MDPIETDSAQLELARAQHELEREKFLASVENAQATRALRQQELDDERLRNGRGVRGSWRAPVFGFVAGVIGSLSAFYTGILDIGVRDRAVDVQEMRIAFDMLQVRREQVGPTYRDWACSVLEGHSEADLDCAAEDVGLADFSSPVSLSNLTIGSVDHGDPLMTDIGLFVCESSDENSARQVAGRLRDEGLGNIALSRWNLFNEISRDVLTGRTTIVFDPDHPEQGELPRIRAALQSLNVGEVVETENPANQSEWYISIILCDV